MKKALRGLAAVMLVGILFLPRPATAQYSQDFDGLNGSPAGVVLTGQDDYYLPSGTGDTDFMCYTYAGNALGVVQNPQGGTQFIGGTGPGDGVTYARAQRNVTFGFGVWEIWYDFCGIYSGTPPGSNNLGSFSMRQSTNTVHINLFTWVDPNNPTAINDTYIPYDANGAQFPIPGTPPGPEWSNLLPNHWYRCRTVVDLDQNLITEVGIRDLSGGVEAVYIPTGWYLFGGATPLNPPDAIRWFGGGGGPGNTTCWDNAIVEMATPPVPGACCDPATGACILVMQDQCLPPMVWNGAASCDPNPCPPPVPTEKSTWGGLKHEYR